MAAAGRAPSARAALYRWILARHDPGSLVHSRTGDDLFLINQEDALTTRTRSPTWLATSTSSGPGSSTFLLSRGLGFHLK